MNKNYRSINIFISHPFEPNNSTYDLEKFRTNIKLLVSQAENFVRREYKDFEIETIFEFSDLFDGLPQQIENKIRSSHLSIVDITENKPNIFFEYGLLYGLNIPVLMIKTKDSMKDFPIPPDLKDRLPIVYESFEMLLDTCSDKLAEEFKKLINSDSLYNIYLNKIWFPNNVGIIHVITSTEAETREFASPESDNYMLLESLGDKDSLLEIMTFLNRNYRNVNIPMYAADNSHIQFESDLVVIGGPGDEGGDENNVCKIMMAKIKSAVSYSDDCEKLIFDGKEYVATKKGNKTIEDYGYFARFPNPFNQRSSVILINGIHTFGVLGAAKVFSDHPNSQGNIKKLLNKFKLDDIKQAAFECFFPVEVMHQNVVCPNIQIDKILPLEI